MILEKTIPGTEFSVGAVWRVLWLFVSLSFPVSALLWRLGRAESSR